MPAVTSLQAAFTQPATPSTPIKRAYLNAPSLNTDTFFRLSPLRFGDTEVPFWIQKRIEDLERHLTPLKSDQNVEALDIPSIIESVKSYLKRNHGKLHSPQPFMVGYGGPSAGGKSQSAKQATLLINESFSNGHKRSFDAVASYISMDGFYKDKSAIKAEIGKSAFLAFADVDTPKAWDMPLFCHTIKNIIERRPVTLNEYDFAISKPISLEKPLDQSLLYLVDGNLLLSNEINLPDTATPLHQLFDLRMYCHTSRFRMDSRWLKRVRDLRDAGVSLLAMPFFYRNVLNARKHYVEPSKNNAQIVLKTASGVASMKKTQKMLYEAILQAVRPLDAGEADATK